MLSSTKPFPRPRRCPQRLRTRDHTSDVRCPKSLSVVSFIRRRHSRSPLLAAARAERTRRRDVPVIRGRISSPSQMPPSAPPHELEEAGTTVVLLGAFNPRIFQPMWFAARGLLAESDVDAQSVIVSDGFSAFSTNVATMFCAQERCQFSASNNTPSPDVVRDLVVGTFSILKETPIWEVGINHTGHIPASVRRWDDVVAQFGDPHRSYELLPDQYVLTIELRAPRQDRYDGSRTAQLQPSRRLEGGVYFNLNDDVVLRPPEDRQGLGAVEALDAIDDIWDGSRALADRMHDRLAPA